MVPSFSMFLPYRLIWCCRPGSQHHANTFVRVSASLLKLFHVSYSGIYIKNPHAAIQESSRTVETETRTTGHAQGLSTAAREIENRYRKKKEKKNSSYSFIDFFRQYQASWHTHKKSVACVTFPLTVLLITAVTPRWIAGRFYHPPHCVEGL